MSLTEILILTNVFLVVLTFIAYLSAALVYGTLADWKSSVEGRALTYTLRGITTVLLLTALTVVVPLPILAWLIISVVAYIGLAVTGFYLARVIYKSQVDYYRERKRKEMEQE